MGSCTSSTSIKVIKKREQNTSVAKSEVENIAYMDQAIVQLSRDTKCNISSFVKDNRISP